MTKREAFRRSGQVAPRVHVHPTMRFVVDIFWRLKRFCAELTDPILPAVLRDYCEDQGIALSRFERHAVYTLDYEVRTALSAKRAENDRYISEKGRKGK